MAASEDCSTSEGLFAEETSSCSEAEETSIEKSPSQFRSLATLQASFGKRCQVEPLSPETVPSPPRTCCDTGAGDIPSNEASERPRDGDDGGDMVYSPRLRELTTLSRMKLACEVRKTLRSPSKKFRGLAELVADYNAQKALREQGSKANANSDLAKEEVNTSKDNVILPHAQHVEDSTTEDFCRSLPAEAALGRRQQIAKACPQSHGSAEDANARAVLACLEGSARVGQSETTDGVLGKSGGD